MQVGIQTQAERSHLLRVMLEEVTAMPNVIEYYIPEKYRKQTGKWIRPEQRGKIIPFPTRTRKSARGERCAW